MPTEKITRGQPLGEGRKHNTALLAMLRPEDCDDRLVQRFLVQDWNCPFLPAPASPAGLFLDNS